MTVSSSVVRLLKSAPFLLLFCFSPVVQAQDDHQIIRGEVVSCQGCTLEGHRPLRDFVRDAGNGAESFQNVSVHFDKSYPAGRCDLYIWRDGVEDKAPVNLYPLKSLKAMNDKLKELGFVKLPPAELQEHFAHKKAQLQERNEQRRKQRERSKLLKGQREAEKQALKQAALQRQFQRDVIHHQSPNVSINQKKKHRTTGRRATSSSHQTTHPRIAEAVVDNIQVPSASILSDEKKGDE